MAGLGIDVYIESGDGDDLINIKTGEKLKEKNIIFIVELILKNICKRIIKCNCEKSLPIDLAIGKLREFVSSERPDLAQEEIEIRQLSSGEWDSGKWRYLDEVSIDSDGCHNYKIDRTKLSD